MIIVKKIDCAGGACPYQLEGETADGQWIYIRYRNGWLRYAVAKTFVEWTKRDNWYDFNKKIGEDLDGYADHEFIYPHLKDLIQFPEGFRLDSYPENNT